MTGYVNKKDSRCYIYSIGYINEIVIEIKYTVVFLSICGE